MKASRYSSAALSMTIKSCVAAIVICALLVGFMHTRLAGSEHRNELAAQHIVIARAHLSRANERQALVEKYLGPYDRLVHQGSMQRFDRAAAGDWFEGAIRGPGAAAVDSYLIGKDAPFAGSESAELTAFQIISHPLEFTAKVDNEDDFVELMRSIETRVPGTTAQEACSLTRGLASDSVEPLAVRCALVWYEFAPHDIVLEASTAQN
jgi:hypothetical protein